MTEKTTEIWPGVAADEAGQSNGAVPLHPTPVVSFDGIWRHWGRGKNRWAVLRDVNLQVAPGTTACAGGRNGAGKTTLLRIATGILVPDQGTVAIDGLTARGNWREYHRRIGFLAAGDRGLYNRLTVRAHFEFWARLSFVPARERKQAIDDALVRFQLADLQERRAERLSQGQRQRLRLALAVVHRPVALLLDEPGNSLDEEGLELLRAAVSDVLDRNGAVIWCSPAGERQRIEFDRAFLIDNGRLIPA